MTLKPPPHRETGHFADSPALRCVSCGRLAWPETSRWRNYHFEDLDGLEEPDEPVYCPECADRRFR
jgi:hypothetical protein